MTILELFNPDKPIEEINNYLLKTGVDDVDNLLEEQDFLKNLKLIKDNNIIDINFCGHVGGIPKTRRLISVIVYYELIPGGTLIKLDIPLENKRGNKIQINGRITNDISKIYKYPSTVSLGYKIQPVRFEDIEYPAGLRENPWGLSRKQVENAARTFRQSIDPYVHDLEDPKFLLNIADWITELNLFNRDDKRSYLCGYGQTGSYVIEPLVRAVLGPEYTKEDAALLSLNCVRSPREYHQFGKFIPKMLTFDPRIKDIDLRRHEIFIWQSRKATNEEKKEIATKWIESVKKAIAINIKRHDLKEELELILKKEKQKLLKERGYQPDFLKDIPLIKLL